MTRSNPRTIDQQIAEDENRVQRFKTKKRTKDTRRKIIVGATIIPAAFEDKKLAQYRVHLHKGPESPTGFGYC